MNVHLVASISIYVWQPMHYGRNNFGYVSSIVLRFKDTRDVARLFIATCTSHKVFMRQMNNDKPVKLTTSRCIFNATAEVSVDTNQNPYDIINNFVPNQDKVMNSHY